jgi:hypothetical protein
MTPSHEACDCAVDTVSDGETTKGGNWGILGPS